MPKIVSSRELERIADAVARHPLGTGVEGLLQTLGPAFSRRTLQRRLAQLVEQKRLVTAGEARALRYLAASAAEVPPVVRQMRAGYAASNATIPVSPAGEEIRAYIRQPRQQRRPVGYQLEFLERYQPNRSAYLPPSLSAQLHDLGRSPVEQAPAGTFARDILGRLLIDLAWASSQLEGNTYTRLDTERLIEFGQAAEGKNILETQMILNHKAAIEYLVQGKDGASLTPETLIALHALLSDGLMADPLACGRLRRRAVDIGGSVYLPLAVPQQLEELFAIVTGMAAEIRDPFEQTFFLMVHLPYLQPFEDVNKRVSRLAANIPLIRANLCPLSFIDVPQQAYVDGTLGVYELNRIELLRDVFVWAYQRSCQQYVAVRRQLVPPDTFRLRYRHELSEAILAIVRGDSNIDESGIGQAVPPAVADGDRERFIALVREEFRTLHPGNAIRFGLGPLEFSRWLEAHGG